MASISTLVHEVEHLDNRSLDKFISNIINIRVRRNINNQQKEEAKLLEKINKGLPLNLRIRFDILNQKRLNYTISEVEYTELELLLEKVEKLNVNRLKHLTSLALLRGVSVRELILQLELTNG